jgi:hypothetical protein
MQLLALHEGLDQGLHFFILLRPPPPEKRNFHVCEFSIRTLLQCCHHRVQYIGHTCTISKSKNGLNRPTPGWLLHTCFLDVTVGSNEILINGLQPSDLHGRIDKDGAAGGSVGTMQHTSSCVCGTTCTVNLDNTCKRCGISFTMSANPTTSVI